MPFTLSHTVAVIPLQKVLGKTAALSPLIIGSMTPDVAYLTPYLVHQRMDSHSLLGVYLFCIPMGLTLYYLYHLLMAPVIVSILPRSFQQHLSADLFIGRLPNISSHVLLLSLIIGALTHVAWDFVTHQSGLPQYIHWMNSPLASIDGYNIMPYRVLQHLSSLLGLGLLFFWIAKWHQRKNSVVKQTTTHQSSNNWHASNSLRMLTFAILLAIPILAGVYNGYLNLPKTDVMYGMYSAQVFIRYAIVGGATAFLISCITLGLLYQLQIRRSV
jgi:hypothetical protein